MNDLNIDDILDELKTRNVWNYAELIKIDENIIRNTFNKILKTYNKHVHTNLRDSNSFDAIKYDKIPKISSDARVLAEKARISREPQLNKLFGMLKKNKVLTSIPKTIKAAKDIGSWANQSINGSKNARACYWTHDMILSIQELIPAILAVWTLMGILCFFFILLCLHSYVFTFTYRFIILF